MEPHIPYEERTKRQPDFIVEYEVDLAEEIKNAKPGQGMRVDFLYDGDDPQVEGVHMIWPEILDESGRVITDTTLGNIPKKGYANMWVLSDERRIYHHERLKVGTKATWWRGGRVAYVTVVKVSALEC
ncbi:hypothetical protein GCM10008090_01020 [Arenicella chitinivorans]|uniref:Uncharacterized protein n=1 Tax=Arenicella chitinivorans TaxID=1329800 RepID=A0A918RIW5_9GAMM|nr:hypothetical protein [Arenicella chitinivorans]GGZ96579.1 hypothetical protein GCM10008090_01020 [Arenicella chitinivorans]